MRKAHIFFNETKWDLLEPGDLFTQRARGLVAADFETTDKGFIDVKMKTNAHAKVGFGFVFHITISHAKKRPKKNPISDENVYKNKRRQKRRAERPHG